MKKEKPRYAMQRMITASRLGPYGLSPSGRLLIYRAQAEGEAYRRSESAREASVSVPSKLEEVAANAPSMLLFSGATY